MATALRLTFYLAVMVSFALNRLTIAVKLTDRSDCRDIFRLNIWFVLDMKHAPNNMEGPWKLVETMFNKVTDPTVYFPNLREYTFSVSYSTPGTKVPDFYTISPCNTTQCLQKAIQAHKAYKSSTKTSNIYSSMEEIYFRGPVNGQQGRGLQEFVMLGTKILLFFFTTGTKRASYNWESMFTFLPIRGLVSIRIDSDPNSKALIAEHEFMMDFYHFLMNASFSGKDDAKEVTRAIKAFHDEPIKAGKEMCQEVNYCQYSGRVGPCIRDKNGTCFKYADIQLKGGRLCLEKGYILCKDFEPCGSSTMATPALAHKAEKGSTTTQVAVAAKLAVAPASTTAPPALTAGVVGISAFIIIVVLIIAILLFVILRKKRQSQVKTASKLDKSTKKSAASASKSGKAGDRAGEERTAAIQASMVMNESGRSKSTARTGSTTGTKTPPIKKTSVIKNKSKTKSAPSKSKQGIRA